MGFTYGVLPCEVVLGTVANLTAVGIWKFGRRSSALPYSTYFFVMALVDCFILAFPGTLQMKFIFTPSVLSMVPELCRFHSYFMYASLQCSNVFLTILTIERTLTILFPIKFQSKGIKRRSSYVLIITSAIILLVNIPFLIFTKYDDNFVCHWGDRFREELLMFEFIVDVVINTFSTFIITLTCNIICFIHLCKFRGQATNDNRSHVLKTFRHLTFATSFTFLVSNFLWIFTIMLILGWLTMAEDDFLSFIKIADVMLYLNSACNPLIYYIVCIPAREDFKDGFRRVLTAVGREKPTENTENGRVKKGDDSDFPKTLSTDFSVDPNLM